MALRYNESVVHLNDKTRFTIVSVDEFNNELFKAKGTISYESKTPELTINDYYYKQSEVMEVNSDLFELKNGYKHDFDKMLSFIKNDVQEFCDLHNLKLWSY